MSKHDAAPTYGWVFWGTFHKNMSKAFILILIILVVVIYMAYSELKDDCSAIWTKQYNVFGYEVYVGASNETEACTDEPT